jgi:hypothetical protein
MSNDRVDVSQGVTTAGGTSPPPVDPFTIGVKEATGILALAGIVAFTILRVGQVIYYARLGTHPEDVGMSYTDTLTRSVGVLAYIALSWVPVGFVWLSLKKPPKRSLTWGFVVSPVTLLALSLIGGLVAAASVRTGGGTAPWGYFLPLSGDQVHVQWSNAKKEVPLPNNGDVVMLGTQDDKALLYDHTTHTLYRLPSADLFIRSR